MSGSLSQVKIGQHVVDANVCCGSPHPFDSFRVPEEWLPGTLNCLIVGESPGGPRSSYFYALDRPVRIRLNLLLGLHEHGLIESANLTAFKKAGYFFDHAIRCKIRPSNRERDLAKRYKFERVARATHLRAVLFQVPKVWVMGYVARNAVACLDSSFPRTQRSLSPAYVLKENPRYFISRYLLYVSDEEIIETVAAFKQFLTG